MKCPKKWDKDDKWEKDSGWYKEEPMEKGYEQSDDLWQQEEQGYADSSYGWAGQDDQNSWGQDAGWNGQNGWQPGCGGQDGWGQDSWSPEYGWDQAAGDGVEKEQQPWPWEKEEVVEKVEEAEKVEEEKKDSSDALGKLRDKIAEKLGGLGLGDKEKEDVMKAVHGFSEKELIALLGFLGYVGLLLFLGSLE